MSYKAPLLLLFIGFTYQLATAQAPLDWLIKQAHFKPILKAHLKEVTRKGGPPLVSTITFSYKNDTLVVRLSAITTLSELEEDLPVSFTTIQHQPFLIYDGSEKRRQDETQWFETVKTFVGAHLCDDLTYRKLLAKPGPKELVVPCGWLYHPSFDQSLFWKGHLIRHTFRLTG